MPGININLENKTAAEMADILEGVLSCMSKLRSVNSIEDRLTRANLNVHNEPAGYSSTIESQITDLLMQESVYDFLMKFRVHMSPDDCDVFTEKMYKVREHMRNGSDKETTLHIIKKLKEGDVEITRFIARGFDECDMDNVRRAEIKKLLAQFATRTLVFHAVRYMRTENCYYTYNAYPKAYQCGYRNTYRGGYCTTYPNRYAGNCYASDMIMLDYLPIEYASNEDEMQQDVVRDKAQSENNLQNVECDLGGAVESEHEKEETTGNSTSFLPGFNQVRKGLASSLNNTAKRMSELKEYVVKNCLCY